MSQNITARSAGRFVRASRGSIWLLEMRDVASNVARVHREQWPNYVRLESHGSSVMNLIAAEAGGKPARSLRKSRPCGGYSGLANLSTLTLERPFASVDQTCRSLALLLLLHLMAAVTCELASIGGGLTQREGEAFTSHNRWTPTSNSQAFNGLDKSVHEYNVAITPANLTLESNQINQPNSGEQQNKQLSSIQRYKERRNFGKRLIPATSEPMSMVFGTMRQPEVGESSPTMRGHSGLPSMNERLESEGFKLGGQSQFIKFDGFISNLIKNRAKQSPLFGSLNRLTNKYLNVSNSMGVSAANVTDADQFIISPPAGSLQLLSPAATLAENAQESHVSMMNVLPDYNGTSLDYQIVEPGKGTSYRHNAYSTFLHHTNRANASKPVAQFVYRDAQPEWQSTNIEQVIRTKKHSVQSGGKTGKDSRLKEGSGEQRASGEKLRDSDESSYWKRERSKEEVEKGSGKKGAEAEAKFLKDLGHNRHGWKNVYHKEEYANHQKFHDVFRDKSWDDRRAKLDEKHQYNKGDKFNESLAKNFYNRDKHGTKYDYSKGNDWKRYEDEQNEADEVAKDDYVETKKQDQANQVAGQVEDKEGSHPEPEPEPEHASSLNHQQQEADQYESQEGPSVEEGDSGSADQIDDAVIEQMKAKLDRLSGQTGPRYSVSSSSPNGEYLSIMPERIRKESNAHGPMSTTTTAATTTTGASPTTTPASAKDDDYEIDWTLQDPEAAGDSRLGSHESINDILKTARKVNGRSRPQDLEADQQRENSDDEIEPESQEKPRVNENRRNELRLKLELDLGKSVGERLKMGNGNNEANNLTSAPRLRGSERFVSHGSLQEHNFTRQRGGTGGWQAKDVGTREGGRHDFDSQVVDYPRASSPMRRPHSNSIQMRQPEMGSQLSSVDNREPKYGFGHQHQSSSRSNSTKTITSRPLSSLNQVLPSRPIFVKHLQMNGGVVLGKVDGLSANRSVIERPRGPIMSDDMSIEGSLLSALGDHNELNALPEIMAQPNLPEQLTMLEQPSQEYLVMFGDNSQAESHQQAPHLIPGEPKVIFEADPSNVEHGRQPFMAEGQTSAMGQLVASDNRFTLAPGNFGPSHPFLYAQVSSQTNPNQAINSARELGLQSLLKSTYAGSLIGQGSNFGASIVAPTMQQAFGRLLRLPKVFGVGQSQQQQQQQQQQPEQMQQEESLSTLSIGRWRPFGGSSLVNPQRQHQKQQQAQQKHHRQLEFGDLTESASRIVTSSVYPSVSLVQKPKLELIHLPPYKTSQSNFTGSELAPKASKKQLAPESAEHRKRTQGKRASLKRKQKPSAERGALESSSKVHSKPAKAKPLNYTMVESVIPVSLVPSIWMPSIVGVDLRSNVSTLVKPASSSQSQKAKLLQQQMDRIPYGSFQPPTKTARVNGDGASSKSGKTSKNSDSNYGRASQQTVHAALPTIHVPRVSTKAPTFSQRFVENFKTKLNLVAG